MVGVEEWFAVGAAAEGDFRRRAAEIGGEDMAHAGVGADPAGAVEGGAKSVGTAALAGVEDDEFGGVEGSGGDLPDPDVDAAGVEVPEGGGWVGG